MLAALYVYLFYFEYVFVEVLLEVFVGKVNAKLLKRVPGKHFKSKNVQHTNGISLKRGKSLSMSMWAGSIINRKA